jgi:hypothetical protein
MRKELKKKEPKNRKKGTKYVLVVIIISEGVVFHSCVIKVIQGSWWFILSIVGSVPQNHLPP